MVYYLIVTAVNIMVFITNYVFSAKLNCVLNLNDLASKLFNVIYKPKTFNGAILKHKKIKGTCLVFKTGNIVINGTKTYSEGKESVRKFSRLIQKSINPNVKLSHCKVATISAVANLSKSVDYSILCKALEGNFEPEIFHALRVKRGHIHYTIFHSGKIIITGLKHPSDIDKVIYPFLLECEMCDY